jgi:hypothetical protein
MVVGDDLPPTNTKLEDLLTATPVVNVDSDGDFEGPKFLKLPNFKKLQTLIIVCLSHLDDIQRLEAHVEKHLELSKKRTPEFKVPRVVFKKLVR